MPVDLVLGLVDSVVFVEMLLVVPPKERRVAVDVGTLGDFQNVAGLDVLQVDDRAGLVDETVTTEGGVVDPVVVRAFPVDLEVEFARR